MNFKDRLGEFVNQRQAADFWLIAQQLQQLLPEAEIYLVGGMVRDIALGRPSNDYDFVVRQIRADDLETRLKAMGTVQLVGKNFGVFKWHPAQSELEIDIALPRTDQAFGTGGYKALTAIFDHNLAIEEDLARRDFTINALALNLATGEVIDPFGGLDDLNTKLIRTVGDSSVRFQEDYSRLLRGLRFVCQLGFRLELTTYTALVNHLPRLNDQVNNTWVVARELIAKELIKSFIAQPIQALDLYYDTGALNLLLPEVLAMKSCPQPANWHSEGDVYTHTRLCLERLLSDEFRQEFGLDLSELAAPGLVVLGALLHDIGKPSTLQTPEKDRVDRIRFNNHDQIGGIMAHQICERLALAAPPGVGVNCDHLAWVVKHHLLHVPANLEQIKKTTLEKYFFHPDRPGEALLQVMWLDGAASLEAETGQPALGGFRALKQRLSELSPQPKSLPRPLLNGHEIMNLTGLSAGPWLGQVIESLREAQLGGQITSKQEAIDFVKKLWE